VRKVYVGPNENYDYNITVGQMIPSNLLLYAVASFRYAIRSFRSAGFLIPAKTIFVP